MKVLKTDPNGLTEVWGWVDFVTTHDLSVNLVQCFSILYSHVDVFVELW